MKPLLLLFLTISLGSPLTSFADMRMTSAPTDDQSITAERGRDREHEVDTISTGQSAVKRDYESGRNYKMCRDSNGSWLRPGDTGYTTCMKDAKSPRR